jgi:hypothetical protein
MVEELSVDNNAETGKQGEAGGAGRGMEAEEEDDGSTDSEEEAGNTNSNRGNSNTTLNNNSNTLNNNNRTLSGSRAGNGVAGNALFSHSTFVSTPSFGRDLNNFGVGNNINAGASATRGGDYHSERVNNNAQSNSNKLQLDGNAHAGNAHAASNAASSDRVEYPLPDPIRLAPSVLLAPNLNIGMWTGNIKTTNKPVPVGSAPKWALRNKF